MRKKQPDWKFWKISSVPCVVKKSFLPSGSMWTDTRDGQVNSCSRRNSSVGHWLEVQHPCIWSTLTSLQKKRTRQKVTSRFHSASTIHVHRWSGNCQLRTNRGCESFSKYSHINCNLFPVLFSFYSVQHTLYTLPPPPIIAFSVAKWMEGFSKVTCNTLTHPDKTINTTEQKERERRKERKWSRNHTSFCGKKTNPRLPKKKPA